MGIPRFFAWLKNESYPNVIQSTIPDNVDWLIFDANSLFHQAHQVAYAYGEYFDLARARRIRQMDPDKVEREFQQTLMTLLLSAVVRIRPSKGILIAVDGVAPQAKIQQQRQRRYKSSRTSDRDDDEKVDPTIAELHHPIVDPNRITPGTDFMFRLDDFFTTWLKDRANTLQLGVETIIYSSHLVPGEGEHKYLNLLRSGQIPSAGTHVIHGMDADLFILSLISSVDRIYITRDDVTDVVSIADFRHHLFGVMKQESTPFDFAVLTFLLGNDFLPHQPSLLDMKRGIKALLSAYTRIGKPLTSRVGGHSSIIWPNFVDFLTALSTKEGTLLADEAVRGFKYTSIPFDQALSMTVEQREFTNPAEQAKALRTQRTGVRTYTFDYGIFRDYWYQHALGARGETEVLEFLFGRQVYPVTIDRIVEQCISYLRGLSWNLSYYLNGNNVTTDYVYPYHHVPLFSDLVNTLMTPSIQQLLDVRTEKKDQSDFNSIHQLLAVLPFESQALLPLEVQPLMNLDSPIYDLYPDQFVIDREATNRKWEGIGVIPFAEIDRIVGAVSHISFPEKRWDRYQSKEDVIVTIRKEDAEVVRHQRNQVAKVQRLLPSRGRGRGSRQIEPRGERVRQPETRKEVEDWRSNRLFI